MLSEHSNRNCVPPFFVGHTLIYHANLPQRTLSAESVYLVALLWILYCRIEQVRSSWHELLPDYSYSVRACQTALELNNNTGDIPIGVKVGSYPILPLISFRAQLSIVWL